MNFVESVNADKNNDINAMNGFIKSDDDNSISLFIHDKIVNTNEFELIDPNLSSSDEENKRRAISESHAVHSTLNGNGMIERYDVYRRLDQNEIWCIIHFGDKINGYSQIIHGGITAMMIDNSFGWLFFALKLPLAVTANLNINYRAPIKENSTVLMKVKLENFEGRKMMMSAIIEDPKSSKVLADATSLFITIAK
eukprot:gene6760-9262_t